MLQATIMICKGVWNERVGERELTAYEVRGCIAKQTNQNNNREKHLKALIKLTKSLACLLSLS